MIKNSQISLAMLLIVGSLAITGCANLAPWERGNLAKPHMAINPDPIQTNMRAHNYGSREAGASVNSSGGGGGCGCF